MRVPLRIVLVDTKSRNPNHYICLAIWRALQRHPGVDCVFLCTYGDAIEIARRNQANLFIAFDGESLNREIAQRLAAICRRSILWVTEDPYENPINVKNANVFDLVFTNDEQSVASYGDKGRYLPFAADPLIHASDILPEDDKRLRYDVCFIGSAWPNRVKVIGSLLREFPDLRWKIGLVTNSHLPAVELPLPESSYTFRVSPEQFGLFANASRVVLGLHRSFTTAPGGLASTGSPPPRLFEVAMAGTAQICDSSISTLSKFFEPGKEVLTYSSFPELCSVLRGVLDSPDSRYRLAKASQLRAFDKHTFDERVQRLISEAQEIEIRHGAIVVSVDSRPVLLQVVHNVAGRAAFGGVEVYLKTINRLLSREYKIYTLCFDQLGEGNEYIIYGENHVPLQRIAFDGNFADLAITVPAKEEWFARLLAQYRVGVVHFQHLLGFPLSLPIIARALGIPSVLTLHDFWGLCDSFNLLDERERYCHIDERSSENCDSCSYLRRGITAPSFQASRRQMFSMSLSATNTVIVNTQDTARRFEQFFPEELAGRVAVLPVPLPTAISESGRKVRLQTRPAGRMRVGLLGNVSRAKGLDTALAAMRTLSSEPIEFVVLGRISKENRKAFSRMPNVSVSGAYNINSLPSLLADIDVTLHLSLWPETYCMSLSEAWSCGCVPVVSKIGAFSERVIDHVNGFLVEPDDPHDLARVLRRLIANKSEIDRIRCSISARLWLSEEGHADRLTDIYRELVKQSGPFRGNPSAAPDASRLTLFDCGVAVTESLKLASGVPSDATRVTHQSWIGEFSLDEDGYEAERPLRSDRIIRRSEHYAVTIDDIRPVSGRLGRLVVGDTVLIRGWATNKSTKKPSPPGHLAFIGDDSQSLHIVATAPEARPDVAAVSHSSEMSASGFRQIVRLELDPGRYEVCALDAGFLGAVEGNAFIEIVSAVRQLDVKRFRDRWRGRGSLDYPLSTDGLQDAHARGDILLLDGWIEDPAGDPIEFYIALESELDGTISLITASRHMRPDVVKATGDPKLSKAGFRAFIDSQAISSGTYAVIPAWRLKDGYTFGEAFSLLEFK